MNSAALAFSIPRDWDPCHWYTVSPVSRTNTAVDRKLSWDSGTSVMTTAFCVRVPSRDEGRWTRSRRLGRTSSSTWLNPDAKPP